MTVARIHGPVIDWDAFTMRRWLIDVDLGERGVLTQDVDGLDLLYAVTPTQAPFLEGLRRTGR